MDDSSTRTAGEVSIEFLRPLFQSRVEEEVAHRWAPRLCRASWSASDAVAAQHDLVGAHALGGPLPGGHHRFCAGVGAGYAWIWLTLGTMLPPESVWIMLATYCIQCHGSEVKKGGLDLQSLTPADAEIPRPADVLKKVIRKLRARQMPPVGKDRPDDRIYDAVVAQLELPLDRGGGAASGARAHRNLSAAQPRGISKRDSRLAGGGHRRAALLPKDDASHGVDRGQSFADAVESLHHGGGKDQPPGPPSRGVATR